jgi:hypothetical protein
MINIFQGARLRLGVAAAIASTIVAAGTLTAQPFEDVFGRKDTVEQGARRVTPLRACGEGFVAVGTTAASPSPTDIYLVVTRTDGTPLWEMRYDLYSGGLDRGAALAELTDGSGFVITGTTRRNTLTKPHVFLLKVRCDGKPLWARAYESGGSEQGFDVVEAQTGDPAFGTSRGDLLVAGAAVTVHGRDALLFRTRPDGSLLWNFAYDHDGWNEQFRALTEAKGSSAGTGTGDVVAAGIAQKVGSPLMGYALRVNGNNGSYAFAPHNAVVYPHADPHLFESVVELRQGVFGGHLAFAGSANNAATSNDVTLLRTAADPAVPLAGTRIGDPAATPLGVESALDLHEVVNPLSIAGPGDIAVTGRVGSTAGDQDAFLLIADPNSLKPSALGHVYGDHASRRDWGVSVSDHPRGFVIAGTSESDFELAGDPSDLYLIGPDDNGKTGCSKDWQPRYDSFKPDPVRIDPRQEPAIDDPFVDVKFERLSDPFVNCP